MSLECEVCQKAPPDDDVALHRVNKPGELPGRWRCTAHLTADQTAAIDPEVREIAGIISADNALRKRCYESLASDVCPACHGKKKTRQSFCLKDFRKLPRATQQALYNPNDYAQTWKGAMEALRAEA